MNDAIEDIIDENDPMLLLHSVLANIQYTTIVDLASLQPSTSIITNYFKQKNFKYFSNVRNSVISKQECININIIKPIAT